MDESSKFHVAFRVSNAGGLRDRCGTPTNHNACVGLRGPSAGLLF